jgi:hypothetical protein
MSATKRATKAAFNPEVSHPRSFNFFRSSATLNVATFSMILSGPVMTVAYTPPHRLLKVLCL